MLNCRIEQHGAAFMIRANDERIPPYAYMTYQPENGRYADFRGIGVKLASVAVYAGDRGINPGSGIRPFRKGFMTAPGVYDFSAADRDFSRAICGAAPGDAFILPRLMLEMPLWWEEAHPDARCLDAEGVPSHSSFSSALWLAEAVQAMERFEEWLDASGWNEYVVGWHIAAGSTEEYIRPVLHPLQFLDYSQASLQAYHDWLRARYAAIDALNAAWGSRHVSFEGIEIPSPAARAFASQGGLRDPAAERELLDFYEFYSDEIAVFIQKLCAEGKRITHGRKLMGVFYGNVSICSTEWSHNSMNLLLDCEDIDFFASPFCYTDNRGPAHDWPFQATLESAHLHGKPWFVEADVRTLLSRPISSAMPHANPEVNAAYDGPVWHGPDDLAGSLGNMLKAFSRILTHSAALWWFDMWGGWYDREELMEFQDWAFSFYRQACRSGGAPSRSQLAVFLDEKVLRGVAPNDGMAHALCYQQMVELGWVGAPYDSYLLSDFASVQPDSYRAALLLSPAGLTDAQRRHLDTWKCGGRTVMFAGYPSYFEQSLGEGTEILHVRDEGWGPLAAAYRGKPYPQTSCTGPKVTLVAGAGDVVLASDGAGKPVAVLHRARDYQTVWSVVPEMPAEMVRDILLLSRAHIYCHGRENIYAGGDLLTIHACSDGIKRIFLPSMGKAFDVFTGARIPGTELWVEMAMRKGESRMMRLELTR